MKSIHTLVDDIYNLFTPGDHEISEEFVEELGRQVAETVASRIQEAQGGERKGGLRMSNVGRPERQLYYEVHGVGEEGQKPEELKPQTMLQFMFGDVWESILLYLAKEAGHTVTHEQGEVTLNGVKGHNDAIIDGVVVDVKSASPFAIKKFETKSVVEDDPFGYMEQLSGYCEAHGKLDGAFLAVQKVTGKLVLCDFSWEDLEMYNVSDRIDYMRDVLDDSEPPDRCYDPVPEGKSGNLKLDTGCKYCAFKHHCWSDANDGIGLRTFIYSDGPRHFTHVEKTPRTEEVTF